MAIYSISNLTTNITTANAALELRTSSTARATVLEIGLWLTAATASTYGLGRPQAIGITPTTPQTGLAEDFSAPTGNTQTSLAWGTGPTVPLNFFRMVSLPNTIGTGVIWTFPRGLIVPVSSSLVLWNLASNGAVRCHIVWDE